MDVLVIGAGVVGLAIARALALRGHGVIVAEATAGIGNGVSSRNSEVIHGGMYYPSGSLRARHCVAGRRMLYEFCGSHGVPHARCGKLIVATNALEQAKIAFRAPVERIARIETGWNVQVGGFDPTELPVDAVVNAAGLGAQGIARATELYPKERVPPLVLAKGNYFGCLGRPAFSRLIYPAPVDGGLGTHVTLDLAGRMRFGPDVEWIDREAYEVDPDRAESFYPSIRRYWPGLPDGALVPDYSGIRPKLTGAGEKAADFMIDGPAEHGLPGLGHLFGIERPGLTSCPSIAEDVADRLSA